MIARNQGSICLGPTGNLQGSYAFLLIRTERNITLSQFTEIPTPPRVTKRVIDMDMHYKQQKGLVFRNQNGVKLPMIYEDGPGNGTGAVGVYIRNIDNHQYL